MASLSERDKNIIWHPYTQMKLLPEAIGIVRGEGSYLIDESGKKYLDAISSWWLNLHGHAHPYIADKVNEQLRTLEHVIFAGFTHRPAIELAERLLTILPNNQKRIFYSDNGSTAVEVALKIALQYHVNISQPERKRIIALDSAYHGDTFGAMSVSGRSSFTEVFSNFLFDVDFLPFPFAGREEESMKMLELLLQRGTTAACIFEPLVQGASGMRMYTPEILENFYRLCEKYDTLIIADEVMTGFGRTGSLFASEQAQTAPDIICLSKGLTGGTLPMGITSCTEKIFDAFYSADHHKTLYHGHSYTANPLACAAGLASLDILMTESCFQRRKSIDALHRDFGRSIIGHSAVADVRQTGTILAIELKVERTSYHHSLRDTIYNYFLKRGILMRPLGNIFYLLPPYCFTDVHLHEVYGAIWEFLDEPFLKQ